MFPPGHVGIALLLYAPLAYALAIRGREKAMTAGVVALVLLTLAPDLDVFVPWLAHRGLSHSIAAAVCLGFGAGTVGWASGWTAGARRAERAAMGVFVGFFGGVGHLAGDVITPWGVQPFAPVHPATYTLDLVAARDPTANVALFALGFAAFELARRGARIRPDPSESSVERSSVETETTAR